MRRTPGQQLWNHICAGNYGPAEQKIACNIRDDVYSRYVHLSRLFSLFYQPPRDPSLAERKKHRMLALRSVQSVLIKMKGPLV